MHPIENESEEVGLRCGTYGSTGSNFVGERKMDRN